MPKARGDFWIERYRRQADYERAAFAAVVVAVYSDATYDVQVGDGATFYDVPTAASGASFAVGDRVVVGRLGGGRGNRHVILGPAGAGGAYAAGGGYVTPTSDQKVKVSGDDSSAGYLEDKLTVAGGGSLSTDNPGGNEQRKLTVHAQSHVLATDTALGADHTITGGVAGWVLRCLSSTTAKLMQLVHSDLGGVTADQHHAESHVLATTSGLSGTKHTVSGLTSGQVLRASGASDAAFAQLQHSDLGGVTADQHHAQSHVLDGANHTISGKTARQVLRATTSSSFAFQSPDFRPVELAPGAVPRAVRGYNDIPDPGAEVTTDGATPDWWTLESGSNGAVTLDSTDSVMGRQCLRFTRLVAATSVEAWPRFYAAAANQYFLPVAPESGRTVVCSMYCRRVNDPVAGNSIRLRTQQFDRTGTYVSGTTIDVVTVTPGLTWAESIGYLTLNANARYLRVYIQDVSTDVAAINLVGRVWIGRQILHGDLGGVTADQHHNRAHTLGGNTADHSDVVVSSPSDAQVLTYVAANSRWENKAAPASANQTRSIPLPLTTWQEAGALITSATNPSMSLAGSDATKPYIRWDANNDWVYVCVELPADYVAGTALTLYMHAQKFTTNAAYMAAAIVSADSGNTILAETSTGSLSYLSWGIYSLTSTGHASLVPGETISIGIRQPTTSSGPVGVLSLRLNYTSAK